MNSSITKDFRQLFAKLPPKLQLEARKNYRLWQANPRHPSLHFKRVGDYWSARVTMDFRVLGRVEDDTIYWFWIGKHAEYERLLRG